MQILEPPQTTSYSNSDGHFIKTFLISTKPNAANWQISKETGHQKVTSFVGKPFVIIPDNLSSERQKGHIFANSRDDLLEEYKKHTHGIIESISSPYFYADGTDDYFYMANIKLNDSKAASALLEHGAKTWIPFAVSPHIWHIKGPENNIDDWEGISLSLVPQGAYGQEAVINKYCKGDKPSCDKSLAASLCPIEDSLAASTISSLLSQNESKDIMSSTTVQVPQVTQVPDKQILSQTQEPIKDENKNITLTKEEYETLQKSIQESQKKDEQINNLINKDKTNTLNEIFKTVKEDSVRNNLFERYLKENTDVLKEFYKDVTTYIVPSLIEEAKVAAEQELKNKVVEENKNKSKAGSLPKEPVVEESSKAASIVPKSVNQVRKYDRLMRGEF